MCIAVVKPPKQTISKRILKNCFYGNPDGAGIMYALNGKIYIDKGYFEFKPFWRAYRKIERKIGDQTTIVLHCRIATAGQIDESNCHPFMVNDELAFCHNGILEIKVEEKSELSDTMLFNEHILSKLPKDFLTNSAIVNLLELFLSPGNKFVFLDNKGRFYILNEKAGTWDRGIWYSNITYKTSYKRILYFEREDYPTWEKSKNEIGYVADQFCLECGRELITTQEKCNGLCYKCDAELNFDQPDFRKAYNELTYEEEFNR